MDKNILLKTHKHPLVLLFKTLKTFFVPWIILLIIFYILQKLLLWIFLILWLFIFLFLYFYFFWSKSYFVITDERLYMNVRNGFFSKYDMSIHLKQIKDIAYSKNHFFHYFFWYGNLFIRSSAGAEGNFIVWDIPNIQKVYDQINYLYTLWEERKNISNNNNNNFLSKEDIIKKVEKDLLDIDWIKEIKLLNDEEKKFIFTNEEDRNHWVYECIKRDITFVATHDSSFRDADNPIVFKLWKKVIFPAVSFHEVKQKNTVSSSPWIEVHNFLIKDFKNIQKDDATLLIWFDV